MESASEMRAATSDGGVRVMMVEIGARKQFLTQRGLSTAVARVGRWSLLPRDIPDY
jgi:hypothetical protein